MRVCGQRLQHEHRSGGLGIGVVHHSRGLSRSSHSGHEQDLLEVGVGSVPLGQFDRLRMGCTHRALGVRPPELNLRDHVYRWHTTMDSESGEERVINTSSGGVFFCPHVPSYGVQALQAPTQRSGASEERGLVEARNQVSLRWADGERGSDLWLVPLTH